MGGLLEAPPHPAMSCNPHSTTKNQGRFLHLLENEPKVNYANSKKLPEYFPNLTPGSSRKSLQKLPSKSTKEK